MLEPKKEEARIVRRGVTPPPGDYGGRALKVKQD
jgi:hypothetical protein